MKCPVCSLINPPTAQICDCGYNFETQTRGKPIQPMGGVSFGDRIIVPTGNEFVLAGLGSRWLGQVWDGLIALAIALIVLIPVHYLATGENARITLIFVVYFGYLLFSDGFKGGQSWGKKIMKTAVIDSYDGKPCSYWQSLIRNIFQVLSIFDWIFIFGQKRQRLGDKAAGTVVVRFYPNTR